jgi:hypothetical protein
VVLCDGRHPHCRTHARIGATSWRLRKKMTCWTHMSAIGEGMVRKLCVQIRSDSGSQRL